MTLNDMSSHVKSFSQILDVKSCQVMSCQCQMTCHLVTALVKN